MIAQVYGTIVGREKHALILRADHLAYRIYAPAATIEAWAPKNGQELMLWTHLSIREDSHDLYGFETPEERRFFELLLSVSGIGPKSALAILNLGDVATLSSAIASGDVIYLTRVSGIGKKSAEKIILELRDKLGALAGAREAEALAGETDALEALQALGYNLRESREALKHVFREDATSDDLIKAALKALGKSK